MCLLTIKSITILIYSYVRVKYKLFIRNTKEVIKMENLNVGDIYYNIESDHKTLLELKVSKVEDLGNEKLIFFTSNNNCDFWNGAYSVSEDKIGKFIFNSKEEALKATEEYKNRKNI